MNIEEVEYLGLHYNCIYGESIRSFLFVDIDTKDPEVLRLVVQECARNHLSFYVLETRKGFHVISPDLLKHDEWYHLKNKISKFLDNYYIFHVIRMSNKKYDEFIQYNIAFYDGSHEISKELCALIERRFNKQYLHDLDKERIILQWLKYTHHEIEGIKGRA